MTQREGFALVSPNPQNPLAAGEMVSLEMGPLKEGWVRVKVAVAALNHHDIWSLRGVSSHPLALPRILGCDAAGIVTEAARGDEGLVGSDVVVHCAVECHHCRGCRSGTRCDHFALLSEGTLHGTIANYVDVPAENAVPLPPSVSFAQAVCLPTAYLTAHHMLFRAGGVSVGSTVLIQGAWGGVSVAARQLALLAGATVIVTSRDPGKLEALEGAHGVVLDKSAGRELRQLAPKGVDVTIETVGEATWDLSLKATRTGGRIIVSGATSGGDPPSSLTRLFWKELVIMGATLGSVAELRSLVDLVAQRRLVPLVAGIHPFAQTPKAFESLLEPTAAGKQLITMPS